MISIKAENKGKRTELTISIQGRGEDILYEAVHIMEQLPKRIEVTSRPLYLRFIAALIESDMFDVETKISQSDEEEGENDD